MPIANWFSKPRWKHKDATLRAEAVSTDSHPDLLRQLADIALSDEAPVVRVAATRRLDDVPLLLKIATSDPESRVQKSAWQTLEKQLLQASDENTRQWREQLAGIKHPALIRTLAEKAASTDMRAVFQQKLSAANDISAILLSEPEASLRLALARRLEKPATLKRTLKLLGKKDPPLRAVLQQQLEKHDPESRKARLEAEALALCEQLEALIHGQNRHATSHPQQLLDGIQKDWQSLLDKAAQEPTVDIPTALQNRYQGAFNTAAVMLDPSRRESFLKTQQQQRAEQLLQEAESWLKQADNTPDQIPSLKVGQQLYQRLQALESTHLDPSLTERHNALQKHLDHWLQEHARHTTETPGVPDPENDVTEKARQILRSLDKTRQKSHIKSRDLTRLRRDWDALTAQHPEAGELNELNTAFRHGMEQLVEKLEQQHKQCDQAAAEAITLIDQVDAAVKDGHLAEAKQLFNQHVQKKKIAGASHPLIRQNKHRIDRSWNALKELRQWQKWSNDKVRQDLIDELKAIPTTGWHPDAILAKLKASSAQWKALEEQEKLDGDRYPVRNAKMWKEFRALQDALFELAQPYFAERAEHWNENLQRVQKQLATLQSLQVENLDTRQLAAHVREAVDWLKKLETLPPAERGKIAGQLREHINRLDKPLKTQYNEARARKESLIKKSQALLTNEDLTEAIAQAKALQAQWKKAGHVPQAQERKLWKRFRTTQDAVFARLEAEKKQARAEQEALRAAAQEFLASIQAKANTADSPEAIRALLGELENGWQAHRQSGLTRAYAELEKNLRNAASDFSRQQHIQSLELLKHAGDLCTDLETGAISAEKAQNQWQDTVITALARLGKAGHSAAWKAQQQRFAQAMQQAQGQTDPATKSPDSAQHARDDYLATLIAAEFLTGLETPAEFQEQRTAYQIDRLSRRMSGETLPTSSAEAQSLLEKFYTLSGLDESTHKAQQTRQQRLENALLKLLKSAP